MNGHHHTGARVVNLTGGRVEFRTASGETRQADLASVDTLLIERGDAFADFNQAERYLSAREWGNALLRYKRAARLAEEFWADLIAARMLVAADRAKRLDEVASAYLRVTRAAGLGPLSALALFPQNLPTIRDAAATRALQQLDEAVAANPDPEQRLAIDLLGYELLRSLRDPQAGPVGVRLTGADVPQTMRTERVYASILSALEKRLANDAEPAGLAALNVAMTNCPKESLPDFLLLKGRVLLREAKSREDIIRASWAFLRVVTHASDDPRAADALLEAAKCLERINRRDKATELLRECLAHRDVSAATSKSAKAELERLGKL